MAEASLKQEEIERFLELDEKRRSEQRKVDAIEREVKPLKEKIRRYVEAKGGSDRTTVHCGYVLALQPKAGRVEWKTEFIALAGHEVAEQLQADVEPTYTLSVEPAMAVPV